jgi:hypothetical protein
VARDDVRRGRVEQVVPETGEVALRRARGRAEKTMRREGTRKFGCFIYEATDDGDGAEHARTNRWRDRFARRGERAMEDRVVMRGQAAGNRAGKGLRGPRIHDRAWEKGCRC